MTALEPLIEDIRAHPNADLYREHWGAARSFDQLPVMPREVFVRAPLSHRSYRTGQGITKIAVIADHGCLITSLFSDIRREPLPLFGKRPLVYFEDAHQAIEESLRAYCTGAVPLAAEKHPHIASAEAKAYEVDSLVCDPASIEKLEPYLSNREKKLASITLVGANFNAEPLARYARFAERFLLVLSLPETGPFAQAAFSKTLAFTPLSDTIVEARNTLIITKPYTRAHPIVRYDTGIDPGIMDASSFV